MIWSCTQYVHTRVTTKHVNGMIINNSIKKKKNMIITTLTFIKTTIKKTKTKENYSKSGLKYFLLLMRKNYIAHKFISKKNRIL